jgi:C1A family cysteine protease
MPTHKIVRKYGFKKSPPQPTDKTYSLHSGLFSAGTPLPASVDLRSKCPPVYDQGELGSCTANAGCCAVEFDMIAQGEKDTTPSRMFLYFVERDTDGDVNDDGGSTLRTCIQCIDTYGVCDEPLWPYNIDNFTVKPSNQCYVQALTRKGLNAFSLNQNLYELQHCLAVYSRPFVFGITLYDSFESDAVASNGIVPMPHVHHEKCLGGHAITCVGYKSDHSAAGSGYFIIRNSWGPNWGDKGYFYLPYAYVLNPALASDFWCVQKIA